MPLSNSFLFPRDISTLVFYFLKQRGHSWFTAGSDTYVKWGLWRPVSLGSCSHCVVSLCAQLSLSVLIDALEKVPEKFPQSLGWSHPPGPLSLLLPGAGCFPLGDHLDPGDA